MNGSLLHLLILAAIAVFLILRLKNTLGTRDGFEAPAQQRRSPALAPQSSEDATPSVDLDITDHSQGDKALEQSLRDIKDADPTFNVSEFMAGAKSAYEMILMAFENGDLSSVRPFLSDDIYQAFDQVITSRNEQGLVVNATFMGVSEVTLKAANFNKVTRQAELKLRFMGELVYQVHNAEGEVVEGSDSQIKRQKDVWSFGRNVDENNPNWSLIETGA